MSHEAGADSPASNRGIFGEEEVVLVGVRESAEPDADPTRIGLMCALPGTDRDSVVLEPRDGDESLRVKSGEIEIVRAGEKRPAFRAPNISYEVLVTDARITFACSKYTKGGTFVGGATALALNAAVRARAAQTRRGKMMVGHVRYPWLSGVYARNYQSFVRPGLIRLVVRLPGEQVKTYIDIEWPKSADAIGIASEIVRRASRFRLRHDPDLTEESRAQLVASSQLDQLERSGDAQLAGWSVSRYWPVSARSARFGL